MLVGILDTGINMEHEEFKDENGKSIVLYAKSRAAYNGCGYIGDKKPFTVISIGENRDMNGHGTHCSGIL